MLKAGVGSVDISPEKGVQLAGYPHEKRENTGVHDSIYASVIHINNGETRISMVYLDLLSFSKKFTKMIREQFDYPITFTCTHTHCAPWMIEPFGADKAEGASMDEEYVKITLDKIIKLLKDVEANTFDAEIATTIGDCGADKGIGGNRRIKGGVCDTAVNVLAVREKGRSIRGIMVNYALHPTYLHAENTLVTSDYPCYIRRYFYFAEPDAVVMFGQGCSGNQSSRYHRVGQDFEEAARAGTTIAAEVDRCLETAKFTSDVKIVYRKATIDGIPLKIYPPVEEAKRIKKEAEAYYESVKDEDYITARNAELAMFGAQHNYYFSIEGECTSEELPLEVGAVVINDTLIVQLQGEWFVEYGLGIKEISGYDKTFVCEVSNGYLPGYMYTKSAASEGGYEVGTSRFNEDAEEYVMVKIKEIIENV